MEKIKFKEFFQTLFSNGESYAKDVDVENEVNSIIAEENKDWLNKLEKSVTSNGNKTGKKKSDRINVKAANKDIQQKSKNIEREEER